MLKASENGYDWLGIGFYFWENNYERALEFAQNPPGKKKYKKPSVLGAVIDLQYCLDLLDTEYLRLIKDSYNNIVSSANLTDQELPQNKTIKGSKDRLLRELDCAVIENLHTMQRSIHLKPFDSVRGVFVEGEELYPGEQNRVRCNNLVANIAGILPQGQAVLIHDINDEQFWKLICLTDWARTIIEEVPETKIEIERLEQLSQNKNVPQV